MPGVNDVTLSSLLGNGEGVGDLGTPLNGQSLLNVNAGPSDAAGDALVNVQADPSASPA